jgi:drug/metabolite transporter (DMT)-like permease
VLKEQWRARTFVATGTSLAGLVLLLGPWNAHAGPNDALGAVLGAGSAVFYASNVLVNKRLTSVFSGSELMFFHGIVATPLLVVIAYFTPGPGVAALHRTSIALLTIGGLFPGALAGLLFVWGLRRIAASHASVLALLEPVLALAVGAALLGEPVGSTAILGGALVLAGAALVVSRSSSA